MTASHNNTTLTHSLSMLTVSQYFPRPCYHLNHTKPYGVCFSDFFFHFVSTHPNNMSSKRPASSPANVQRKKSRKRLNLDMKLSIISRHEGGEGANSIARALSLSQSTVSTVIKKRFHQESRSGSHCYASQDPY